MPRMTMLDIAKINGSDAEVGLIEEVQTHAPDVMALDSRTIRGTNYKTLIRAGLPSVGFRKANQGIAAGKSRIENKLVECYIFGGRVEVDRAVTVAHEDGEAAFKAMEAAGVAKASLINIGSQLYYGTAQDGSGFPGLQALADPALTMDAGGTTAATGSSVYAVYTAPDGVRLVFGGGKVLELGDWREETIYDDDDKGLPGFVADLMGWVGLQCVNKNAVGRLRDCTADSGKGVTDAKVAELLSKFPVGMKPNLLFMSRRSAYQLQTSRGVTIFTSSDGKKVDGSAQTVAPMPTESNGVPIVVTDSLVDTEALS